MRTTQSKHNTNTKDRLRPRWIHYFEDPVKMRSPPAVRGHLHHFQTSLAPGVSHGSRMGLIKTRQINGGGNTEASRENTAVPRGGRSW